MFAAIDIGGTKIRLTLARSPQDIVAESTIATPPDQDVALKAMTDELTKLVVDNKLEAISITSPARIDKTTGVLLAPRNIPWKHVGLASHFGPLFGCPVVLEHDSTAGGIAEARLGAGRTSRVLLYVTFSTGVGTSVIVNGQPLATKHNSEGGQMIVNLQPEPGMDFEVLAGGKAIEQRFGYIAKDITDPNAWDEIAKSFSVGLFSMMTLIQPDVVVLAGGVAVHYDKFIAPLNKHLADFKPLYPLPEIKRAKFVETAPTIGALILARERIARWKS